MWYVDVSVFVITVSPARPQLGEFLTLEEGELSHATGPFGNIKSKPNLTQFEGKFKT